MPHEIRAPRLGWSSDEATFLGWLVREGEPVEVGQPIYELEGEKALQVVEAVDAGVLCLAADAPQPGAVVSVGALLGYLLGPGESPPWAMSGVAAGKFIEPACAAADGGAAPADEAAYGQHVALGQDHPPSAAASAEQARAEKIASPRARRVARELGVDWTLLEGSGAKGRVSEADVRAAAARCAPGCAGEAGSAAGARPSDRQASPGAAPELRLPEPAAGAAGGGPLSPRRKAIAARLRASLAQTVPVTLSATAEAANLVALRQQFRDAALAPVPGYSAIAACLAVRALKRHPLLAARASRDGSRLVLPTDDGWHVGIAVETPAGLLVPVVRDVARRSLAEVAAQVRELAGRAREGRLSAADMEGGVFTISNLGAHGVESFTPVLNDGQTAILGLGAIRREAVVHDDERIAAALRITLSLTFDHALVDGAPAAALLAELRRVVENPAAALLGG